MYTCHFIIKSNRLRKKPIIRLIDIFVHEKKFLILSLNFTKCISTPIIIETCVTIEKHPTLYARMNKYMNHY